MKEANFLIMDSSENPSDISQAKTLHQAGEFAEAENVYKKVLEQEPENAEALALLGVLYCQSSRLEDGVGYLRKAARYDPHSPETYYNLGKALDGIGLLEDAVAAYQAAIKIKDDYAAAWNNSGDCLSRLGRLADAVNAYEKALKLNPIANIHFNLGNALLEKGDLDSASQCYRQALDSDPGFAEAALNLAIVLKRQGDLTAAKSWCKQTLEMRPDYVKGLNEMGILCSQMGQTDEAIAKYKRVLELDSDNSVARHLLDSLLGADSEKASPAYVEELFDQYASRFESHLAESLQYKTPSTLHSLAKKILSDDFRISNILDLGCGTGLCGPLFRPHCGKLYGVDISSKMIKVAYGKKIYDELKSQEIVDYLNQIENNFDLFLAADVFVYFGNLEPVFQAITESAEEDASFIFSTETTESGFALKPSGRFGHSRDYVETVASKFNWKLEDVQSDTLRVENGLNVSGNLFFFRLKN